MTLQEAQKILLEDNSTFETWAYACGRIAEDTAEKDRLSPETLYALVRCLKKPITAGIGVACLYAWTKRPRPPHFKDHRDHCRDPEDWLAYLKANKFLD